MGRLASHRRPGDLRGCFLRLKGCSRDLIISGGSDTCPGEVEEILMPQRVVREVSVVGRPGSEWGEAVVALLCLTRELVRWKHALIFFAWTT
jgi:acyl-CoA synthetase (AMP-forming)/AMP-acid ligase II